MKKILAILSLIVIFSVASGCVNTTVAEINGTIYNRIDYRVKVYIENKITDETVTYRLRNESQQPRALKVGDYNIWAYTASYTDDWENEEYIGGDELEIRATDTSFSITVYNDSLLAQSY